VIDVRGGIAVTGIRDEFVYATGLVLVVDDATFVLVDVIHGIGNIITIVTIDGAISITLQWRRMNYRSDE